VSNSRYFGQSSPVGLAFGVAWAAVTYHLFALGRRLWKRP
jgi:hypothetical protein